MNYTNPTMVTDIGISAAPRSGQTVSGYGGKIPTRYNVKYNNRWHRVYSMVYGNSGTAYIVSLGEDLIIDADTQFRLEAL